MRTMFKHQHKLFPTVFNIDIAKWLVSKLSVRVIDIFDGIRAALTLLFMNSELDQSRGNMQTVYQYLVFNSLSNLYPDRLIELNFNYCNLECEVCKLDCNLDAFISHEFTPCTWSNEKLLAVVFIPNLTILAIYFLHEKYPVFYVK